MRHITPLRDDEPTDAERAAKPDRPMHTPMTAWGLNSAQGKWAAAQARGYSRKPNDVPTKTKGNYNE